MRITDGMRAASSRTPHAPAIRVGEREVTHGELWERVLAAGSHLRERVPALAGRPVAFLARDPLEFLVAFLGVVETGGIAAPLAHSWPVETRRRALEVLAPVLVLEEGGTLVEVPRSDASTADERPANSSIFYIGFSSGTTGTPKAIARAHDAWLKSFLAMGIEFALPVAPRVILPGDPFFSFTLIAALQALFAGGCAVFPGAPGSSAAMLESGGVLYAVPSVLADIVRRAHGRAVRYEEVTHVITAGEKLPPALRASVPAVFPHARTFEYYGASELGFVTVLDDVAFATHPKSVGRPFLGADVRVLDEAGRTVPRGTVGLLCADTGYGFDHYWGHEKEDITHGGVPTVGDLAWMDADDFVYLAGRRDNMLIVRGENVYPEQVELEFLRLPGVVQAAVVGEPTVAPEHLVAFVVLAPGANAQGLQSALRQQLPARLVPRRIIPVASLPMTPTGKVARVELATLLA